MKRQFTKNPITSSTTTDPLDLGNYQDFWAYQDVVKNCPADVKQEGNDVIITIWYDKEKGDVYTTFRISYVPDEDNPKWSGYLVKNIDDYGDKSTINDELDFTNTMQNCIESCFYYFSTRF